VLPQRYQRIITHDINRILRELAGTGDKKDIAGLTPSSPMLTNGHSHGPVSQLTLEGSVTSPLSQVPRNGTSLSRKNSNPDWGGEMELPFKGTHIFGLTSLLFVGEWL
jgi:WNK lysine deficient protein kinase